MTSSMQKTNELNGDIKTDIVYRRKVSGLVVFVRK